jgi:magnesium transporter
MTATYSIFVYDKNNMEHISCRNLDETLSHVNRSRVNWITLSGITLQEDHAAVKALLEYFELNPLLINSIFDYEQQQFEGEYDDCLYLEYSALLYRAEDGLYSRGNGSMILGDHVLMLLEVKPSGLFEKTRQRIQRRHTLAHRHGADYLLYLLVKTIVINYQKIFKALAKKFEALEDEVIGHPAQEYVYDKILELREEVKPIYDHLDQLDDFVDTLREEETRFINRITKKYFTKTLSRETKDLFEDYQYLRAWITELIEIHRANVNENTNRVIQLLTIISTIFLPLSFIAGVYGMNFEYMPELQWPWAYPTVLAVMAGLAAAALIYMRRKKWF